MNYRFESVYISHCSLSTPIASKLVRSINANTIRNTVILNPMQTSTGMDLLDLERRAQSLSEPLPVGPSSSSWTTSLPTCKTYSALLRAVLSSSFRGSTSSSGRSFALFRILHPILAHDYGRMFTTSADLGSHPASSRISTIS